MTGGLRKKLSCSGLVFLEQVAIHYIYVAVNGLCGKRCIEVGIVEESYSYLHITARAFNQTLEKYPSYLVFIVFHTVPVALSLLMASSLMKQYW